MKSRQIIITGASRGIGYETAKYLAGQGHNVTAVSRSAGKLEELKSGSPDHIFPLPMDITIAGAGKMIAESLSSRSVKADAIIHNAGLLINKPFPEQSDNDLMQQFEANVLAPARITRDLLGLINPGGHIVCISSMGGFQGSSKFPGLSGYSASKGALSVLSECLAEELSDLDVSCNTLCLGAVQTEMLNEAFPGFDAPVQPDEMGAYIGEFTLNAHRFYNGRVLPVSLGNPG